jgi:hypothetical protein
VQPDQKLVIKREWDLPGERLSGGRTFIAELVSNRAEGHKSRVIRPANLALVSNPVGLGWDGATLAAALPKRWRSRSASSQGGFDARQHVQGHRIDR